MRALVIVIGLIFLALLLTGCDPLNPWGSWDPGKYDHTYDSADDEVCGRHLRKD